MPNSGPKVNAKHLFYFGFRASEPKSNQTLMSNAAMTKKSLKTMTLNRFHWLLGLPRFLIGSQRVQYMRVHRLLLELARIRIEDFSI